MACASIRAEGASTSVMFSVATSRSARAGPSFIQASVTGAGRSASDRRRARGGQGESPIVQGGTSQGRAPMRSAARAKRAWGCASPSSARQSPGLMSRSRPGRITCPFSSPAMAVISSSVAPREPVEPASTNQRRSGSPIASRASQRAIWCSITRRSRSPWSGLRSPPVSK